MIFEFVTINFYQRMKKISQIYFLVCLYSFLGCEEKVKDSKKSQITKNVKPKVQYKVGEVVDTLDNVMVYYNGNVNHVSERNLAKDGYNLGLKFQCVEFVKRYYYEHLNHKMPDSYGHAKEFYDTKLNDGAHNTKRNLLQFKNGSSFKPKIKDLIVFDGHEFNPYGHVAIISKVGEDFVEITQQNPGPNSPSRDRIELYQKDGKWLVSDDLILGWLRKKN